MAAWPALSLGLLVTLLFSMTWPLSGDPGVSWTVVWVLDTGPALCVEPPFLALAPPPLWTPLTLDVLLILLPTLPRAWSPAQVALLLQVRGSPLGMWVT